MRGEVAVWPYPFADKGGVVTIEDDVTWIEEMADPKGRSFKALNGHITGLARIADFYATKGNQK